MTIHEYIHTLDCVKYVGDEYYWLKTDKYDIDIFIYYDEYEWNVWKKSLHIARGKNIINIVPQKLRDFI